MIPPPDFGANGKPDFWIGGEGGLDKPLHVAIVAKDRAHGRCLLHRQPWRPAGATMARPEFARIIIRTITARSCSIPTATTSKPFATRRRNALPGSLRRMAGNLTASSSLLADADRTAGNTARDAGTADGAAAGRAAGQSASRGAAAGARARPAATTAGIAGQDAGRVTGARAEWPAHTQSSHRSRNQMKQRLKHRLNAQ